LVDCVDVQFDLDIEEFLELRKNTGDDRRRTHDMNTANWIPDLFMKRVMEGGEWSLFSPSEVGELHDLVGTKFEEAYVRFEEKAARGELDNFVLVMEGSIPNEKISGDGYWAAYGTDPQTGNPITIPEWLDRLTPKALAVVTAGTCAAFGGIHAMKGNPTGCMGVADYLGWDWKSKAGLPIVNVPGCPVQPDNFMETLLYLLRQLAGLVDDGLRHAVGEKFRLRVAAGVDERKDRQRFHPRCRPRQSVTETADIEPQRDEDQQQPAVVHPANRRIASPGVCDGDEEIGHPLEKAMALVLRILRASRACFGRATTQFGNEQPQLGSGLFERRDVASREVSRQLAFTRVRVQRAAAGLSDGRDHLDAVAGQDPRRRRVRVAEDAPHDAALEHGDASARLATSGCCRRRRRGRATWQEVPQIRHAARDAKTGRPQQRTHPEVLRRDGKGRECAEYASMWEEPLERRDANESLDRGPRSRHDDLRTRAFDELSVLDAGRARRLAGATAEASIDVRVHGRIVERAKVTATVWVEDEPVRVSDSEGL